MSGFQIQEMCPSVEWLIKQMASEWQNGYLNSKLKVCYGNPIKLFTPMDKFTNPS